MGADHQGSQHYAAISRSDNMPERLPKNIPATRICMSSAMPRTYPVGNPNALYQPPQDCDLRGDEGAARRHGHRPRGVGAADHLRHRSLAAARRAQGRAEGEISRRRHRRRQRQRCRARAAARRRRPRRAVQFRRQLQARAEPRQPCAARSTASASSAGSSRCSASATTSSRSRRNCARSSCPPSSITGRSRLSARHVGAGHPPDARSAQERQLVDRAVERRPALAGRLSVGRRGGVRPHVLRGGAGPLHVGHRLAARASLHPARRMHDDHGIDHEFKIVDLLERYVPDREARDRVLVDNPAQFFDFS